MLGLMMDTPLLISSVLRYAERIHGDQEVITLTASGRNQSHAYGELAARARRLASALLAHGIGPGDRVATIAWNTFRHLEVFFATTGVGAVCHPINPRLPPREIDYVIGHAGDRIIFFDSEFGPLVGALRRRVGVGHWVRFPGGDGIDGSGEPALPYEEFLRGGAAGFAWPEFDERLASGLYYTSGTTGPPRGVVASHRSTILHSYACLTPDSFGFSGRDTVLCAAPIFHINAWGIPLNALITGARLVLPGPYLDAADLADLMNGAGVTLAVGTPGTWAELLEFLRLSGQRLHSVRRLFSGGSAVAPALIEEYETHHGIEVTQGWGMTETGPVAAAGRLKPGMESLTPQVRAAIKAKQGRPVFGVEVRLVDASGRELPWDGVSTGHLLVKGPWVASGYYGEGSGVLPDGWLPTGDVARIDPDGYIVVTDRMGDVITSGGEWISTLELEEAAVQHPGIRQAAVIGIPHPRWGERPLLVASVWPGAAPPVDELIAFMSEYVPRWWLPDHVKFVSELPTGPTGKVLKRKLRDSAASGAGAGGGGRSPV